MDFRDHFAMLARYNTVANQRLYEVCAQFDVPALRESRRGSFGSIHALLNHLLLGDRIWMARFQGGGATTPPLGGILFDRFADLRAARVKEDARIEGFFATLPADFFSRSIEYLNFQRKPYRESASVAAAHFFNHQTHHRGQVHVMISQTGVKPPSLDLHRIINP